MRDLYKSLQNIALIEKFNLIRLVDQSLLARFRAITEIQRTKHICLSARQWMSRSLHESAQRFAEMESSQDAQYGSSMLALTVLITPQSPLSQRFAHCAPSWSRVSINVPSTPTMMLKNVSAELFQHRIVLKKAKAPSSQFKRSEIVLLSARMISLLQLTKQGLRILDSSLDIGRHRKCDHRY